MKSKVNFFIIILFAIIIILYAYIYMNNNKSMRTLALATVLVAFLSGASLASAATLTRSLDLGMSGSDVTAIQTFLSTDLTLYPSGLVTGYYGQLTKAGIERFQARNGIVSGGTPETTGYGRVGPLTLATLNLQMNGSASANVYAPAISNVRIANTVVGSVTITWNTSKLAIGTIHYQTSFPAMTEGSATSRASIGGSMVTENSSQTSHSVTLSNLQSGTVYYYVVESVDSIGNQEVTWPTTFKAQ
ncbi:MAG: hypothetical protein UY04_C0008G0008 [Parcubacteria group bacterium GW2011_GWA2_47_7]|nr:MAG: hypothetical protein UY04_C0008G0008 [Parcubacteria group bacterium GW2011_GWA2_47_7]